MSAVVTSAYSPVSPTRRVLVDLRLDEDVGVAGTVWPRRRRKMDAWVRYSAVSLMPLREQGREGGMRIGIERARGVKREEG